ncbi:uncharacterized protein [Triticum aestivum]|uniref:uncharacterized protein n=1 Tax=Triticum aestivum TaxID=4565 RepID=UPI001D013B43|nr:uncharacterized protein LOC123080415 [Triticum aestivum]
MSAPSSPEEQVPSSPEEQEHPSNRPISPASATPERTCCGRSADVQSFSTAASFGCKVCLSNFWLEWSNSSRLSALHKKFRAHCSALRASATDATIDQSSEIVSIHIQSLDQITKAAHIITRTIMEPNNDFHKNVFMGHAHQHTRLCNVALSVYHLAAFSNLQASTRSNYCRHKRDMRHTCRSTRTQNE